MARAVLPVCVARNDREWTGYRRGHHLLRVRVNHDGAADPGVPRKALSIQPLARTRPFQLAQSLVGCGSVNVLNRGRLNLRHPGRIGIRLRRHVPSVCSRIIDHLEHHRRFGKAGTIDVHYLQWSIGFAGEQERFLEAGRAGGNVQVYWRLRRRGNAEHGQQLLSRCRRRVWKPGADADRSLSQTKLHESHYLANLFR